MSIKNVVTKSRYFEGTSQWSKEVEDFLQGLRQEHPQAKDFHVVHALVFPKGLADDIKYGWNRQLGEVYSRCGFTVLGGDTSSGQAFSFFISAMVF
jgi:hypothetical protein